MTRKPLKELENIMTFSSFKELYDHDFPLKFLEYFTHFNNHLQQNTKYIKTNIVRVHFIGFHDCI